MTELLRYRYPRLGSYNSIRILSIRPSTDHDNPLICKFLPTAIQSERNGVDSTLYEALSYHWGTLARSSNIYIENIEDDDVSRLTFIPATPNLVAALKRLRQRSEPYLVWADAVCINHDDVEEVVNTVQMMRQIYAGAKQVVIWLGDIDETPEPIIDEAMDVLCRINKALADSERNSHSKSTTQEQLYESVGAVSILSSDGDSSKASRRWLSIIQLFLRPFFSRLWVLQEISASRKATVIWGSREIGWEELSKATEVLRHTCLRENFPIDTTASGMETVAKVNFLRNEQERHKDILWTMAFLRNFETSRKRDKYNGILGLVGNGVVAEPDYVTPVDELYKKLATSNILHPESHLEILSCVDGVTDTSRLRLPSWVPDWTQIRLPEPFFLKGLKIFNACGSSRPEARISESGAVLQVMGRLVGGNIQDVGHPYIPPVSRPEACDSGILLFQDTINQTRAWLEQCTAIFDRHRTHIDDQEALDMLWRILICDLNYTGQPANPDIREDFLSFREYYRDAANHREAFAVDSLKSSAGKFESLVKRWSMIQRCFFATDQSYFGWAPKTASSGDVIAILCGGRIPFVLRPTGDIGRYTILGECYIHGLMSGEAYADGTAVQEIAII